MEGVKKKENNESLLIIIEYKKYGASLVAQGIRLPTQETWVRSLCREDPWRRKWKPTPVFLGFPGGSAAKESACNVEDLASIPGLGRSPREGSGYPLQYFGLETSMGLHELDMTE